MNKREREIVIPRDGIASGDNQVRAIYDPMVSGILREIGAVETQRASHVEPGSELSQDALQILASVMTLRDPDTGKFSIRPNFQSHWFADMTPSGFKEVLGPYGPGERDKALADEVAWLKLHNIPVCRPCRENATAFADNEVKVREWLSPSITPPKIRWSSNRPNVMNVAKTVPLRSRRIRTERLVASIDYTSLEQRLASLRTGGLDSPEYNSDIAKLTKLIHDPNTSAHDRTILRGIRFGLAYGRGGAVSKAMKDYPPAEGTCVQMPEIPIDTLLNDRTLDFSEVTGDVLAAYRLQVATRLRADELKGHEGLEYSDWEIDGNTFRSDIVDRDDSGKSLGFWRFQITFAAESCMIEDKVCGRID